MKAPRIFDAFGEKRLAGAGRVDETEIEVRGGESGQCFGLKTLCKGVRHAAAAEMVAENAESFRLDLIG